MFSSDMFTEYLLEAVFLFQKFRASLVKQMTITMTEKQHFSTGKSRPI